MAAGPTRTDSLADAAKPSIVGVSCDAIRGSDAWYAQVTALPVDQLWQLLYRVEFGTTPSPLADTYFDATRL